MGWMETLKCDVFGFQECGSGYHKRSAEPSYGPKCTTVYKQVCESIPVKTPRTITVPKCVSVPREHCTSVPKQHCKKVPRQVKSKLLAKCYPCNNNPFRVIFIFLDCHPSSSWEVRQCPREALRHRSKESLPRGLRRLWPSLKIATLNVKFPFWTNCKFVQSVNWSSLIWHIKFEEIKI